MSEAGDGAVARRRPGRYRTAAGHPAQRAAPPRLPRPHSHRRRQPGQPARRQPSGTALRLRCRRGGQRRGSPGGTGALQLHAGPDGLPDAAHGRLRRHPRTAPPRKRLAPHPPDRPHRQRLCRRPRSLHAGRHGRSSGQARQPAQPRRNPRPLVSGSLTEPGWRPAPLETGNTKMEQMAFHLNRLSLFLIACPACRAQTPPPVIVPAATANAGDEAAIKDVVARYVDARDRKDAKATESLFTADADQLVSSGDWRKGRDAVVRGAMASSESSGGKRTITVEAVRFPTPGVALADGRYEIAGLAGAPPRRMWSTFLITRTPDGWRIAAIRNMLPAPPAPPK